MFKNNLEEVVNKGQDKEADEDHDRVGRVGVFGDVFVHPV